MTYRHVIYTETAAYERLKNLSVALAAQRLQLDYTPRAFYFKEDPAGKFGRPFRVSGFCDHHTSACDFDIFIRANMKPSEIANIAFHECYHVAEFNAAHLYREQLHVSEDEAEAFATYAAPDGSNYDTVFKALQREYKPPTPNEVKAAEHAKRAGLFNYEADEQRKQLAQAAERYRLEHWKEIAAEKQRRAIEPDLARFRREGRL